MPWWSVGDKRGVQRSLLRLISFAQSQQLALAPLVSILASEHQTLTRMRLQKLAKRLATGTPLVDALEQTPRLIEDQEMLTIRFALQSGTLKTVLPSMLEQETQALDEDRFSVGRSFSYYACLAFIILVFILFLTAFIFPTFVKLFQEMEIRPNQALVRMNATTSFMFYYFTPVFLWFVVLSIAAWLLSPIQWFRRWIASRLFWSVAERRNAQLLRMLATASDAGRPIAGSMSTLARYHFDRAIRTKLLFARNEIELGAEPWSSLATAKLLSHDESTSLANSTSSRTRSWLMLQVARVKEDKIGQRVAILSSFVHPAIIALFGLLVLWIALACFGTLTDIVKVLADQ